MMGQPIPCTTERTEGTESYLWVLLCGLGVLCGDAFHSFHHSRLLGISAVRQEAGQDRTMRNQDS